MATTQTVEHLDPRTLLVDLNVRADARLTKNFVASIKTHGVLQPVVAVRTADGDLRVRHGHRRTLAAIEAGRDTVPVIVAGNDNGDDVTHVERIVQQHAENEHRAGLTNTERVAVVEQLAAFGLSPTQISRRTHRPRTEVDAALTVSRSDLAKAATGRYEWLTIDQAATVAELADDPDTVTALIAAAKTGQFDHTAQRARDDRHRATARREAVEALAATGITVIDPPGYHSPALRLDRLRHPDGSHIDATSHATGCPGHVAWADEQWIHVDRDGNPVPDDADLTEEEETQIEQIRAWVPVYGCADPDKHGHRDAWSSASTTDRAKTDDMTPEEREAAKTQRRLVIENNKAWDSVLLTELREADRRERRSGVTAA